MFYCLCICDLDQSLNALKIESMLDKLIYRSKETLRANIPPELILLTHEEEEKSLPFAHIAIFDQQKHEIPKLVVQLPS